VRQDRALEIQRLDERREGAAIVRHRTRTGPLG